MAYSTRTLPPLGASLALLVSLIIGISGNAQAATCKGLSRASCETSTSCSWVKGYTTKSGSKVSAYCRSKSGKSTTTDKGTSTKTGAAKGASDKKVSSSEKETDKSDKKDSSSKKDKGTSDKQKSSTKGDKKKTDKKKSTSKGESKKSSSSSKSSSKNKSTENK